MHSYILFFFAVVHSIAFSSITLRQTFHVASITTDFSVIRWWNTSSRIETNEMNTQRRKNQNHTLILLKKGECVKKLNWSLNCWTRPSRAHVCCTKHTEHNSCTISIPFESESRIEEKRQQQRISFQSVSNKWCLCQAASATFFHNTTCALALTRLLSMPRALWHIRQYYPSHFTSSHVWLGKANSNLGQ